MAEKTTFETTTLRTLRKDRLTNDERMEALWNRQKPDRIPVWPLIVGFAAANVGLHLNDIYTKVKESTDAQVWTCEQYGWQPIMVSIGSATAFPAAEFGGEIRWPSGEFAQAPAVARHPVNSEEEAWQLKMPSGNLEKLGTIPLMMEGTAYMMKQPGLITGPPMCGPMDTAGAVCGLERVLRWLIKRPELIHHVFRIVTDFQVAVAKLWADTFGTEKLMPAVGGPGHSNQILSPKHFEEFCLPYIKEQHAKMREIGYKHFHFHPCGEQNANMPFWAQCDMGDPGIISVGHEIPLETVAKYFPKDIAFGNLEPAKLQVETPAQIYEACRELIAQGKKHPGGYILSTGCEAPPFASKYNFWMMTKATNDFGWYE
ncbi:MAG: uroporphyrinogen decarboxylase family protein [Dehalococcoidia bacterium]